MDFYLTTSASPFLYVQITWRAKHRNTVRIESYPGFPSTIKFVFTLSENVSFLRAKD